MNQSSHIQWKETSTHDISSGKGSQMLHFRVVINVMIINSQRCDAFQLGRPSTSQKHRAVMLRRADTTRETQTHPFTPDMNQSRTTPRYSAHTNSQIMELLESVIVIFLGRRWLIHSLNLVIKGLP